MQRSLLPRRRNSPWLVPHESDRARGWVLSQQDHHERPGSVDCNQTALPKKLAYSATPLAPQPLWPPNPFGPPTPLAPQPLWPPNPYGPPTPMAPQPLRPPNPYGPPIPMAPQSLWPPNPYGPPTPMASNPFLPSYHCFPSCVLGD